MNKSTCTVDGCIKADAAPRGWCWKHYNLWRRHGDPEWSFTQPACSVEACDSPSRASGMCDTHYRRAKKHGDPQVGGRPAYGQDCAEDECGLPLHQAGLCWHHYYIRWTSEGRGKEVQASASARRRARVARAQIGERNLSWRTLWAEGIHDCYLCGIECDPTDYRQVINRGGWMQKICGPAHPSLDHVLALAKGGAHSRGNSELACLRCNSRKHTKSRTELAVR